MASITERLDRSRRRMLVGLLLALIAWIAMRIVGLLGASGNQPLAIVLAGSLILGGVVWLFYLARMIGYANAVRGGGDRPLREVLIDERVRSNRLRAFSFGFGAVLVSQLVTIADDDHGYGPSPQYAQARAGQAESHTRAGRGPGRRLAEDDQHDRAGAVRAFHRPRVETRRRFWRTGGSAVQTAQSHTRRVESPTRLVGYKCINDYETE